METISLRIGAGLLKEIDSTLKPHRYGTRTEFIRDAVRDKLKELEKEEAIRKLTAMKGTFKPISNISDAEAAREVFEEMAREHGVDLE